jgi:hypothetical protein
MHDSDDLRQVKLILFVGVVFLVSAYYSWREFKYLTFGKSAEAQVTSAEIVERRGRRGRRYEKLAVHFSFTDDAGASQSGRQELDPDAEVRTGDVVAIQYIAGDSYSPRHQGTGSKIPVIAFVGSLLFAGGWIWKVAREVNQPIRRMRG